MIGTLTAQDLERPATFVVELDQFSGPLDLLLALIRDEQMQIADIPIARVADQFLRRVHDLALTDAAEYLEMAARLLRIKAQMLLPRSSDDEPWDDPRSELVRRLLEYQQMREVVSVLERRGEDRRELLPRGYLREGQPPLPAPLALSLAELLAAVDRVLRIARKPVIHDIVPRGVDVDGAMAMIRRLLAMRARRTWRDLVPRDAEPWEVLSLLLAMLELARRGELRIAQSRPFALVRITRDAASEAA